MTPSVFSIHYPLSTLLQILDEPLEGDAIRVVVLPVAEVGDEVLAYLARRVLAGIAVEALPIAQRLKPHQPDRKQHPLAVFHPAFAGLGNLGVHPFALHAVLGEISSNLSYRRIASSICS